MLIIFCTAVIAVLFSFFSTAVISYVAMATGIGPWMEMTLVLLAALFFRILHQTITASFSLSSIAYVTASGGIGAAVAMACAFSFPTIYFLDPPVFYQWLAHPLYFSCILASLVLSAGSFGFFLALHWSKRFLHDQSMIFPIGQMTYNMLAIQNQLKKAQQLALGATGSLIFSMIQTFTAIIPKRLILVPAFQWNIFDVPQVAIRTDVLAMFWAIGFITGHMVALPLIVAVLAKIIIVDPLHGIFFKTVARTDYLLAFGAGMAIHGSLGTLVQFPRLFKTIIKKIPPNKSGDSWIGNFIGSKKKAAPRVALSFLLIIPSILFLNFFKFSFAAQFYVLSLTALCAYQLLTIAGKLGIAPLGRFATLVMIPGLLIFGFNAPQITMLASLVEVTCVVAVDIMFGQKLAQLASISSTVMMRYQWLGLVISAGSIGLIFWILITHFGLGSSELIAARAQSRAVLIHAFDFNYAVVVLGFVFSTLLKRIGVNPTLVFGGLLMGLDTSLILIAGGLSTYLVHNKEEHYPFWSGVYATNSVWVFLRLLG